MAATFEETGLDPRLLRALKKQGIDLPTPVQAAAIPKVSGSKIAHALNKGRRTTLSLNIWCISAPRQTTISRVSSAMVTSVLDVHAALVCRKSLLTAARELS